MADLLAALTGNDDRWLRQHFFDIATGCPYGLEHTAVYRQAALGSLSGQVMDALLARGFRRNGNIMYTMACQQCRGCVPIRVRVAGFVPSRSQRRVWRRNRDLSVEQAPLQIDAERLALCERFLSSRYPGRFNSAIEYYSGFFVNSIADTFEITYRRNNRLVGVAVVDLADASLNAVYFYFDPAEGRSSPGTYNILFLLELARRLHKEFLYLGYWIEEVPAMSYKARFRPHELFVGGAWQSVTGRQGPTVEGRR